MSAPPTSSSAASPPEDPLTSSAAYEALRQSIAAVAPEADLAAVAPRESLREALDLDSMDFLAVVERVATATGVTVPESDYLAVDSVEDFVRYLEQRAG
jgi:acyl carrier protein